MAKLSVNIDHVATVRQARMAAEPDVLEAGFAVQRSGASGVTVHLRGDRRHIQDRDVFALKKNLRIKLNLEMAATDEMLKIAVKVKPDLVTLVPEKDSELTTSGGLDVLKNKTHLSVFIKALKRAGIAVSIFVNPQISQIKAAKDVGAGFVEIHTGIFAEKFLAKKNTKIEIEKIRKCTDFAKKIGLKVNAGHGLTYQNVKKLVPLEDFEEMSIGHSIIARSVFIGVEKASKEMKNLVKG